MKKLLLMLALLTMLTGCYIDGVDVGTAVEFCADKGGVRILDLFDVSCNDKSEIQVNNLKEWREKRNNKVSE